MTLGEFTEPKLLVPRLLSERKEGVIRELTRRLETTGRIENPAAFLDAAIQREEDMPTFLGEDVAVPHVRGAAVHTLSFALGLAPAGIAWTRERDRKKRHLARVVFLFAVPLTDAELYLALLAQVVAFINSSAALDALWNSTQPEQIYDLLNHHQFDFSGGTQKRIP